MIRLSTLIKSYIELPIHLDCEIEGLAIDSRDVKPGCLFFAVPGTQNDGRRYIDQAIANGARVVLVEGENPLSSPVSSTLIYIPNLRKKIPEIAAQFYHYPSKSLRMVGITGTNGKTSCSHFIAASLQRLKIPCGVIGTLGNGLYGNLEETTLTTPDPIKLQKILADFLLAGARAVSMEVSSHSLDQGRINGIDFEVGVFTNLTRDHLDYHGTMDAYGDAKRKLFDQTRHCVINADDQFGQTLLHSLKHKNVFGYSTQKNNQHAVVFVDKVSLATSGIHATVFSPWGEGEMNAPLMGRFNLSNMLAVFTTLCLMEISFKTVLDCMSHLTPVPGRMEALGGGKQPMVVVDYSHTPDALEKVLTALRQHCQGKLYCLFGCGGDRDRGKRPIMAKIAEQFSDFVMVTDDNPRTEDPKTIVADILKGFIDASKVEIQHNRSKAIKDIIQYAHAGDCVLIAGKGAESYQQIGNEKIPFSDVEKAREGLYSI